MTRIAIHRGHLCAWYSHCRTKAFELRSLYELDYDTFNLALSILDEWRVDRYYAKKLKLLDIFLQAWQLAAH